MSETAHPRPSAKSTREKPATPETATVEATPAEASPAKAHRPLNRRELEALRDKLRRKYH